MRQSQKVSSISASAASAASAASGKSAKSTESAESAKSAKIAESAESEKWTESKNQQKETESFFLTLIFSIFVYNFENFFQEGALPSLSTSLQRLKIKIPALFKTSSQFDLSFPFSI